MGFFGKEKEKVANVSYSECCFTSINTPTGKIIKNFGMISATSHPFTGSYENNDNIVKYELIKKANRLGANAIINFKFEIGTFQRNGSGWISAFIICYGDAVIIDNLESAPSEDEIPIGEIKTLSL